MKAAGEGLEGHGPDPRTAGQEPLKWPRLEMIKSFGMDTRGVCRAADRGGDRPVTLAHLTGGRSCITAGRTRRLSEGQGHPDRASSSGHPSRIKARHSQVQSLGLSEGSGAGRAHGRVLGTWAVPQTRGWKRRTGPVQRGLHPAETETPGTQEAQRESGEWGGCRGEAGRGESLKNVISDVRCNLGLINMNSYMSVVWKLGWSL